MRGFRVFFPKQIVPEWVMIAKPQQNYRGTTKIPLITFCSIVVIFNRGEDYRIANLLWGAHIKVSGGCGVKIISQSPRGLGYLCHYANLFDALF